MTTESTSADMFSDLIGRRVEVWTVSASSSYRDVGLLQSTSHPWIRVRLDTDEVMCFNVYHIRYVKALN